MPRDADRLWFELADQMRENPRSEWFPALIEAADQRGHQLTWADISRLAQITDRAELMRPAHLVDFLSAFGRQYEIQSAIDPYANSPLILASLPDGARRTGVCHNPETAELARRVSGNLIHWLVGDPATIVPAVQDSFEWLVSSPPVGLHGGPVEALPPGLDERLARADAGLVPVAQALSLIERGLLILLTERFLWSEVGARWQEFFAAQGLHLTAAVSVAEGLAPATSVPTVLCLLEREQHKQLFVGRVTGSTDVKILATNLTARRPARVPELGALVAREHFMGWTAFASRLALERALSRSKVALVPLGDLAAAVERGESRPDEDPPVAHPNALYFDARVVRAVTTAPPEPRPGARTGVPYYEVQLDPDRAHAEFVATWLNGEHGKLVINSLAVGSAQRRVQRKALDQIAVPLPALDEQVKSVALGTQLAGLRQEIANLETRLWTEAWAASAVEDGLKDLMAGDPLRAWIDRLPFPLSAIVMRYYADADEDAKVKRLLHFFEAWAEFHVAALLSALQRHPELWDAQRDALRRPGPTGRHPLEEGGYGGWTHLGFHLAKVFRSELNGIREDDERRALLGVASTDFADALTSKHMWSIVDEARNVRNARGHGGEEGTREVRRKLAKLETLLGRLRDATNHAYSRVEMVQPGSSSRGHGVRRYAAAKHLRGPLTTFVEQELVAQAKVDLIADGLCFVDTVDVIEDALEMIPLVRLLPSPETEQNAAYFFNKQEAGGFKFVSYHFPGEAEAPLDDPGLAAIVADLLG